ncbi:hypothetical protein HG264_04240 [Pseudomonas sp. gcc21]|uniref:hypothetical protein n=1 Tax=Pseudomonas sp. gcc21 TaxID=2726989 RepID=UPI0014525C9A|nr:hypothetical protein [Pseudomonas sp. gcc21]QJD58181.1 hypothetical protein HG264_04240 [Pseudomonas sp. gcc21]
MEKQQKRDHGHYKKDVSHLRMVDVYRVVELFDVPAGPIDHAVKKLLCAGMRGHKDLAHDIQDVIDSLVRWQEMREEDSRGVDLDLQNLWTEGEARMEQIGRNSNDGLHYTDPHG